MDENTINTRAFEFVSRLTITKNEPDKFHVPSKLEGTLKERGVTNLASKLSSEGIATRVLGDDATIAISSNEKGVETGLLETDYAEFKLLISDILAIDSISRVASYDYVEGKSFQWLIDIRKTGAASQNILDFIRKQLDTDVKEVEFFFPVTNLDIVQPFQLGNVNFTYFTEELMNKMAGFYRTTAKPLTEEQFNAAFRKEYQGVTIVVVKVTAEDTKARAAALECAERAVDCLKIVALASLHTSEMHSFDLNHRLNFQIQSGFLSKEKSSEMNYVVHLNFDRCNSFKCDKDFLLDANENGLAKLAYFITLNNGDELYNIISSGIQTMSFSLSIADRHRRIMALISLVESLLLEDGWVDGIEKTTKRRLVRLIPGSKEQDVNTIDLFARIYQIRHQITHRGKKLPINDEDLTLVQIGILIILTNLIVLNLKHGIKDKIGLITYLDQKEQ
jgi:hypothetical protein